MAQTLSLAHDDAQPSSASLSLDRSGRGLFDLDQLHCYCCMQFFAGAGSSRSRKVDGHLWCMACSYARLTARLNDRCSGCPGGGS